MPETGNSVTTIPLLLLILLAALAGCATQRLTFDKAGSAKADLDRDQNACLRSAIGTTRGGGEILTPYCIDRDVFIECMKARGYTVRSD